MRLYEPIVVIGAILVLIFMMYSDIGSVTDGIDEHNKQELLNEAK